MMKNERAISTVMTLTGQGATYEHLKGTYEGGGRGLMMETAEMGINMFLQKASAGTLSVNLGYNYNTGYSAGINVGPRMGQVGVAATLGYTEKTGTNVGVGIRGPGMNLMYQEGHTLDGHGNVIKTHGWSANIGGVGISHDSYSGYGMSFTASQGFALGGFAGGLSMTVGYNEKNGFSTSMDVDLEMLQGTNTWDQEKYNEIQNRQSQSSPFGNTPWDVVSNHFSNVFQGLGTAFRNGVNSIGDGWKDLFGGDPETVRMMPVGMARGAYDGVGGRQLSASDIEEFKKDWKSESPAQTDASLAALKAAGYDTSELEAFVQNYRNGSRPGYVDSNQMGAPIVVIGSRNSSLGDRISSFFGSIADGARGFWNSMMGGGGSPAHYDTVLGNNLIYRLHAEGEGFRSNSAQATADEHRFGKKELVDVISNTINEWRKANPDYEIVTNDLGYKSGGYDPNVNNDPHIVRHHAGGNQADLSYMSTPGVTPGGGNYDVNPAYNREKTIEYIKTISRNIPEGITGFVKFNDPAVREYFKQNPLPNLIIERDRNLSDPNTKPMHSNHLHLQLNLPGF